MTTEVPKLHYVRTPQRVNLENANRAKQANAKLRKAIAAQALLEALGCTVTWPAEPHEDIRAATLRR